MKDLDLYDAAVRDARNQLHAVCERARLVLAERDRAGTILDALLASPPVRYAREPVGPGVTVAALEARHHARMRIYGKDWN